MQDYTLFLKLLLMSIPTLGSCILVFKKDENIYFGADSRNSKQDLDNKFTYEDDYCKIEEAGEYVFTYAGFDNDSAHKIVSDALKNVTNPIFIFDKLFLNIKRHYEDFLRYAQVERPNLYKNVYDRGVVGEIVIAHHVKWIAKLIKYDIKLSNNFNDKPTIKLSKENNIAGESNVLITLGISDNLKKKQYEDVVAEINQSPIEVIKKIVEGEMGHNMVGGPVDLLEITASGLNWIAKKEKCA